MLGFSPFKKRPNKFNYIPRYFDPEKEAREERRAELRGERSGDEGREYEPGQYIRTRREARIARREKAENAGQKRIWGMIAGAVLVLLFIYLLYPRLADVFIRATQSPATTEIVATPVERRDALDQSGISDTQWQQQPIEVVPNDYTE